MEKLLQEIREAEAHAEKIIADGHEKAGVIASKAKADADAFVARRKAEIVAEKADAISSRKKELEKGQQKYLKKAEKEADALGLHAKRNTKKALSALVREFKLLVSG